MMLPYLPAVLYRPADNSLSMERALKQILYFLELAEVNESEEDKLQVSIDDVKEMLKVINRD
jgi:hypothetical protein